MMLAAGLLTGCQYDNINDYLEDLGLRDPLVYDNAGKTGSSEVDDPIADMGVSVDWAETFKDSGEKNAPGQEAYTGSDTGKGVAEGLPGGAGPGAQNGPEGNSDGTQKSADQSTSEDSALDASGKTALDAKGSETDHAPSMGEVGKSAGAASGADTKTPEETGKPADSDAMASESGRSMSSAASQDDSQSTSGSALPQGQLPAFAGDDNRTLVPGQQSEDNRSEAQLIADKEALGLTQSGIAARRKEQEGLYAYERLTDAGKTLYVEILVTLENLASDVLVSTTSSDALEQVYEYVMTDHPEIFYVSGYNYRNYTVNGTVTKITFTGQYTYSPEEVASRKAKINDAVSRALADAPGSDDDYYKIKYVYDYIIRNTDYDAGAEDNQNICSVFINGRSVCNGYAKAAQYLLNRLGVKCTFVWGNVTTRNGHSSRHAWNLVECNGAYYYMDTTWGDASYQTSNGETADRSKYPEVNYDYLNVTTSEIQVSHSFSETVPLPVCNSLKDNYYVREDEYFTSADLSLVGELFDRRYKDGSNNVTIKCATDAVYDSLFEELITNRKVFDYKQGDLAQISYTTFSGTRTIMFWI